LSEPLIHFNAIGNIRQGVFDLLNSYPYNPSNGNEICGFGPRKILADIQSYLFVSLFKVNFTILLQPWKVLGSYGGKNESILDSEWKKQIFIITELVLGLARVYYDCQMFFLVRNNRCNSYRNKKKGKKRFNFLYWT